MAIYFHNESTDPPEINKKQVKNWIKNVISSYKKQVGDINYIFTNDENILKVNIKYLNHNFYTDVITFDYTSKNIISGDIYISLDTVKSNSEKYNELYFDELKRVIIHGILHLIGYKDKTDIEAKEMRKQENKALEIFLN